MTRVRLIAALLTALVAAGGSAAAPTAIELACEPSAEYPWARFVQVFGPDDAIFATVDPSRHPALVGVTCDLHVVSARDAAAWAQDDTLLDVRDGGAQTVTIGAAGVASNTIQIALPRELDADAGYRLGVGYDVVLDCDRDGALGDADWIDGAGDAVGLWAVHDTTDPGPLRTVTVDEPGGQFSVKRIYYPEDVAILGELPLVTISHGWLLDYSMYDYIGEHLASYGYVVMSHGNSTVDGGPAGTESASTTTIGNIDSFLGSLATIAGGVLDGHVDGSRITMMGHSTGGEGIVRAYTRLRDDPSLASHFSSGDIALLAPIAPVAWLAPELVDPGDVPFHMFGGAADIDTSNAPYNSYTQLFTIYERSTGRKHVTYIHGAGHLDFSTGLPSSWADGPDLIGRLETQRIVNGYHVPLLELHVRDNPVGEAFFTRMADDFRPSGIDPSVIIVHEHAEAVASRPVVLDDFEHHHDPGTSSAGAPVTSDASNLAEVLMRDIDALLQWTGFQPANGMTRARQPGEEERCVIFDWAFGETPSYEIGVAPAQRDLSDDRLLSFRAAQGTRHPMTDLLDEPLTLTVTLRDETGATSSIHTAVLGGISRPYLRIGLGDGAGWSNEFNTVRLPIDGFLADGSPIDPERIEAVVFELGLGNGSRVGRLAIDDVKLIGAPAPSPFMLRLEPAGGATALRWPALPEAADFELHRGTIPVGGFAARGSGLAVFDHVCLAAGVTSGLDGDPIPAGVAGFYYLVGVVDADGAVELGRATVDLDPSTAGDQPERTGGAPCP